MTHYNLLAARGGFAPIQASGGTESTFEYNSTWKAHSFTYTGSEQTLTISNPGSEGKLSIICIGAGGGRGGQSGNNGGGGGYVRKMNINIRPYSSLRVSVGGGGGNGHGCCGSCGAGGGGGSGFIGSGGRAWSSGPCARRAGRPSP